MTNPVKILSMDGGNGINTAVLLQRLETASPKQHYLNEVDIFAGTSAGGINALFFAAADKPAEALSHIQQFWSQVNHSILHGLEAREVVEKAVAGVQSHPLNPMMSDHWQELGGEILRTALGVGEAVTGWRSLFLNEILKKFLTDYFGENTTLSSLKRGVVVTTFALDNRKLGIDRSWVPRLFTNLPYTQPGAHGAMKRGGPSPDADEKIVDVAMRTSAAPLELPIYQSLHGEAGDHSGYVDGGLVANNPAMIALTSVLSALSSEKTGHAPHLPSKELPRIHMLSVGTGRNLVGRAQFLDPEFTNGSASWGYRQWLLDPTNPLVLIDAFLQAGSAAVTWECNILMGEKKFHRLDVPLKHMCVIGDPETQERVTHTAEWLESTDWFSEGPRGLEAL